LKALTQVRVSTNYVLRRRAPPVSSAPGQAPFSRGGCAPPLIRRPVERAWSRVRGTTGWRPPAGSADRRRGSGSPLCGWQGLRGSDSG